MAGRPSPALVLEREVRAWDLACKGKSQDFIAHELGITQPGVLKILRRVSTRHLARLTEEVEARKAVHTARLEYILAESLDAWASSKTPRQKSRSRKTLVPVDLAALEAGKPLVGQAAGVPVREETLKEAMTSDGNPAFLLAAMQADTELRKLWGLNAPKKVDLLDQRRPLEQLTDEELRARALEGETILKGSGA